MSEIQFPTRGITVRVARGNGKPFLTMLKLTALAEYAEYRPRYVAPNGTTPQSRPNTWFRCSRPSPYRHMPWQSWETLLAHNAHDTWRKQHSQLRKH